MASNESDGAHEGAKADNKLSQGTSEEVDPIPTVATAGPEIFIAVESPSAKDIERATYPAYRYCIRPIKGSVYNAEDENGRWETTESTLETLDTDQIANEVARLGQTGGPLVIGSQLYSSMLPNQQNEIEKLLNGLRQKEPFYEFSVAELKVNEVVGDGVKRTEAVTVVVQRCPSGQIRDGSTNDIEVGKPESERVVQVNDSRDDPLAKTEIDVSAEVEVEVEDDDWLAFAATKKKKKKKKKKKNDPPKGIIAKRIQELGKQVQENSPHEDLPAKIETGALIEAKSEGETGNDWALNGWAGTDWAGNDWAGNDWAGKKKKKNRPLKISRWEDPEDPNRSIQPRRKTKEERDKEKPQPTVVASVKVDEVEDENIVYTDDFWDGFSSHKKKSKGWNRRGTRGEIQLLDHKIKTPDGSGKVNYNAWWDWITPNDTDTQPQQHFLECWIYSDTDEAAYSIQNLKDHAVSHSIRQAPPTHNGLEPTGGLRLFHCKVENDEPPFAAADFKQIAKALSLPPIYRHVMSRKSGFIGELKNMKGDPGKPTHGLNT
jgi:hypothetical protein